MTKEEEWFLTLSHFQKICFEHSYQVSDKPGTVLEFGNAALNKLHSIPALGLGILPSLKGYCVLTIVSSLKYLEISHQRDACAKTH